MLFISTESLANFVYLIFKNTSIFRISKFLRILEIEVQLKNPRVCFKQIKIKRNEKNTKISAVLCTKARKYCAHNVRHRLLF